MNGACPRRPATVPGRAAERVDALPAYSAKGLADKQGCGIRTPMRAAFIGLLFLTACHHHVGSAGADPKAVATSPAAFEGMPALGTKAFCPVSKEAFTVNAKTASATYKGRT